MSTPKRYKADTLSKKTTIVEGSTSDLKVESSNRRYWLARGTPLDGEPYERTVYTEDYVDGVWCISDVYDGDDPTSTPRPSNVAS
jgi:hypothetical protein